MKRTRDAEAEPNRWIRLRDSAKNGGSRQEYAKRSADEPVAASRLHVAKPRWFARRDVKPSPARFLIRAAEQVEAAGFSFLLFLPLFLLLLSPCRSEGNMDIFWTQWTR